MKRLPTLAVLVSALGAIWLAILTVQFLQRSDLFAAVLTGAAAVGLLWLAREEFLKQRRQ